MGHSARIEGMRGSVTALATPFRGGQLDEAALASLAERQVRRGSAGLVVCGSTGEAGVMSAAEQARAIAVVRESAGTLPVLAGCTAISTDAAASLARQAVRIGADALLLAPPPYVRPTQEGILAHVRAVAHAADRPVMLYDVPSRTGVAI